MHTYSHAQPSIEGVRWANTAASKRAWYIAEVRFKRISGEDSGRVGGSRLDGRPQLVRLAPFQDT